MKSIPSIDPVPGCKLSFHWVQEPSGHWDKCTYRQFCPRLCSHRIFQLLQNLAFIIPPNSFGNFFWLPINRQKDLTKITVCTSLQIAEFRFLGFFIGLTGTHRLAFNSEQ
jgi:hypothetical protein